MTIACSKCNGKTGEKATFCSHEETSTKADDRADGRIDYSDTYTLVCLHCGHNESTKADGGNSEPCSGTSHHTSCPYCGISSEHHVNYEVAGLMTINDALEKPGSYFDQNFCPTLPVLITGPCPKCGAPVICAHKEFNGSDTCDLFNHICLNSKCDHLEKAEIPNSSCTEGSGASCPFCHNDSEKKGDVVEPVVLLTITEALMKPESDFADWVQSGRGASTAMVDEPCPLCASPVVCAHADMAAVDYSDYYNHLCLNPKCHHAKKEVMCGTNMGPRDVDGPSYCPFCSRKV